MEIAIVSFKTPLDREIWPTRWRPRPSQPRSAESTKRSLKVATCSSYRRLTTQGRPTVSYKGGDPGFVKVVDPTTLVFPSYDGNGMFFSMGNIQTQSAIGMLFIDFETPHRVRLQGEATVSANDPMLGEYLEADLIVRVKLSEVWINCPRYIHRYQRVEKSKYVPQDGRKTPMASWKRIDMIQPVLPEKDQGARGGGGRPHYRGGVRRAGPEGRGLKKPSGPESVGEL